MRAGGSRADAAHWPQDLIADLKYELTGKFERLIVGLMRPLAYCDAKEIKDAISVSLPRAQHPGSSQGTRPSPCLSRPLPVSPQGAGTDEKCLIEILASRTNQQIHALVAAYKDGACHGPVRLSLSLGSSPGPGGPSGCSETEREGGHTGHMCLRVGDSGFPADELDAVLRGGWRRGSGGSKAPGRCPQGQWEREERAPGAGWGVTPPGDANGSQLRPGTHLGQGSQGGPEPSPSL